MGMLDDAFESPTRKRMRSSALVPYGTGRQGTTKTPLITPPPRQSTAVTIFSPKQVGVRKQSRQKSSSGSGFNFNDPFGTSHPLGSSSGINAGKRHKGKVVGGIKTPRRGGGIGSALNQAVGRAASKTKRVKTKGAGTLREVFGNPKARKERASIGKQVRKGIHKTLFRGKRKLI